VEVGKGIALEVGRELGKLAIERTKDCLESFNQSHEPCPTIGELRPLPPVRLMALLPVNSPAKVLELKGW
jgi:hypothetical protein